MLGEIAITPSVLYTPAYSDRGPGLSLLHMLKQRIFDDALVRDLCDGSWSQTLANSMECLSPHGKELLKKLGNNNRLRVHQQHTEVDTAYDPDWCKEALTSHRFDPLDCVVTTAETKRLFESEELAVAGEKLQSHAWWRGSSPSLTLNRTTDDYLRHLRLLLAHANSIMFIDPHIDPSRDSYTEFFKLLLLAERQTAPPLIEIHRKALSEDDPNGKALTSRDLEERFIRLLAPKLSGKKLRIEVFVWPKFHDRCLITDLMGISLPNGFDIDGTPTVWTRLGRNDRDAKQGLFDPACSPSCNPYRFTLCS